MLHAMPLRPPTLPVAVCCTAWVRAPDNPWHVGGISNGEHIVLRVAFKPTSTISREQKTVSRAGEDVALRAKGRHDPCVVPRAVPMVEAMVALVLVDHLLMVRWLLVCLSCTMVPVCCMCAMLVAACRRIWPTVRGCTDCARDDWQEPEACQHASSS